jgi:hypothetical protein
MWSLNIIKINRINHKISVFTATLIGTAGDVGI